MPLTGQTGGGASANYVRMIDQKPFGTDGGGTTSFVWTQRDLTVKTNDSAGICALAANVFTLQPGVYRTRISVPCFATQSHRARLVNLDDTIYYYGQNADNSNGNTDKSYITTLFTITSAKQFQIETRPGASIGAFGLGRAQSQAGLVEIYTVAELFQVGVV